MAGTDVYKTHKAESTLVVGYELSDELMPGACDMTLTGAECGALRIVLKVC